MDENFWNERYRANETVYGHQPNVFFKEQLLKLHPGKLLLPAEGEGRNAIFAASMGWDVTAFDFSVEAKNKALALARLKQLNIDYSAEDIGRVILPENTYNAIALIYVHMEPTVRAKFHKQCINALKQGGVLLLEAFSKEQISNASGGPKDVGMLNSIHTLHQEFEGLEISLCKEDDTFLDEGKFHSGNAVVVRLIGTKQ